MNNSIHFQKGSADQYTLWNVTFVSVTKVNDALPRAQEGHMCIHYSHLLTPSSLVLPPITDGSAGKRSQNITEARWQSRFVTPIHRCPTILALTLAPVCCTQQRAWPRLVFGMAACSHTGWRKDSTGPVRQTQGELLTQGAACNPFLWGTASPRMQFRWYLGCTTSKPCLLLSLPIFSNTFLAVTSRLPSQCCKFTSCHRCREAC